MFSRKKIETRTNYLAKLYYILEHNFLTKWYIHKVSTSYKILYPGQTDYIIHETMKTAVLLWLISGLAIIFIFSTFKSFFMIWTVSFYIIVFHIEMIGGRTKTQEIKLLAQFEKYLNDIRHYYHVSNMVEESIEYAIEQESKEMRAHAVKIYNIIFDDDPDKGFLVYNDAGPNKYIRLFLALSIKVIEYGDKIVDGNSLYLSNINHLKNDIHIELLKNKNTKFAFTGLSFVAAIPIIFLLPIRNWGISNIPDLVRFYDYSNGKLLALLIYLITLVIYFMLIHLKDIVPLKLEKNYILDRFKNIAFIERLLNNYIDTYYTKVLKLKNILKESGESIKLEHFILKQYIYGFLAFFISLTYFVYLNNLEETLFLYWYQLILSCVFSVLAYAYPYFMVKYKSKLMKMNMEDEVIQFQSIIMMVKNMERISVINILEFMEGFAIIFKDSIHTCINNFDAGDLEALEELKLSESFEPFRRIIDGLIISDKIGIEKAFDEISTNQLYYQDKRKADNEELLAKKAAIGKFISSIPAVITVGLYLIIPFIYESLRQLSEFSNEWSGF